MCLLGGILGIGKNYTGILRINVFDLHYRTTHYITCVSEGLRCIHVALLCAQDLPKDRPTMTEVVSMLCNETQLREPKEPLFTLQRLSGNSTRQGYINLCSINAVTISMIEGR
ncbi:putative non-specific serine/threonine protein kinase [Helianthus anomalus]